MNQNLDEHLKKYIVDAGSRPYTWRDHAVWRYILRQLKNYLRDHAHPFYVEGLDKTGITIDQIPSISEISEKLKAFGWTARPVSGFIPPAVFMEMQAAHILPIARDMRSLDQLQYTPAPDIVHEAAGHAPMLAHPEYAAYLKKYAQVAKKAIISREDLAIYAAIRKLSDLKSEAHPNHDEITKTQNELDHLSKNMKHLSEATLLSRMNWWTAEYGLIGTLDNPKILGAGLLSSVGEAKWCLNAKVKKIPLTIECINYTYDITEPQPQLFVTPSFAHLSVVLEELAQKMAFRRGHFEGLKKAQEAETVCTVELSSGLQASGVVTEILCDKNQNPIFIKLSGASQISFDNKELEGHSKKYHSHGYSTPLGNLKLFPEKCPSLLTQEEWKKLGVDFQRPGPVDLQWSSGFHLKASLKSVLQKNGRTLLMSFENAQLTFANKTYFQRDWGTFDLGLGNQVVSVFGGPADRLAYGDSDDFNIAQIPAPQHSNHDLKCFEMYQRVREIRSQKPTLENLENLFETCQKSMPGEWLVFIEILEIAKANKHTKLVDKIIQNLRSYPHSPSVKESIEDGILLSDSLTI